jgi:hypothetical protein
MSYSKQTACQTTGIIEGLYSYFERTADVTQLIPEIQASIY